MEEKESRQWGLNPRPSAYKADALPLSYGGLVTPLPQEDIYLA